MRRRRSQKREILPDALYGNTTVAKFINMIMKKGKKSLSERIVYGMFDMLKEKTGQEPLDVFKKAIDNVRPLLETKSRRVGGATYQVPVEVRPDRGYTLALRWMRKYSRERKGKPMMVKIGRAH